MIWETPLGFLGLLGIIILIIIYILKPNYQNKAVSTTYIWKLSLKYRRKKLPINLLRNILILICQILIITLATIILTQPYITEAEIQADIEKVAVVDGSANMYAYSSVTDDTRFDRAIYQVRQLGYETIASGENFSIVYASSNPIFVAERIDSVDVLNTALDSLLSTGCSFGSADVDVAMDLVENVTLKNPETEVYYYSATTYLEIGDVNYVDVSAEADWNAAIVDVRSEFLDNSYVFSVDIAAYGQDVLIDVSMQLNGVNIEELNIDGYKYEQICTNNQTTTVLFQMDDFGEESIYSYDSVYVSISISDGSVDSFSYDDSFYLYGGKKEVLKVLYASSLINPFVGNILSNMATYLSDDWELSIQEYTITDASSIPTSGYDLYIFEHTMPNVIPTDGVCLLINPDSVPNGAGFVLGSTVSSNSEIFADIDMEHKLTTSVDSTRFGYTQYIEIANYDGYDSLLSINGDSVYVAKNSDDQKIAIWGFSLHYSSLAVAIDFPIMFVNFFEYYFPSTLEDTVFEVGDEITLSARGEELSVDAPGLERLTFTDYPATMVVTTPGTYTVSQDLISGQPLNQTFFVKIASTESDFTREVYVLTNPEFLPDPEPNNLDLLIYLAAAIVTLLFVEWWLQSKDQF